MHKPSRGKRRMSNDPKKKMTDLILFLKNKRERKLDLAPQARWKIWEGFFFSPDLFLMFLFPGSIFMD